MKKSQSQEGSYTITFWDENGNNVQGGIGYELHICPNNSACYTSQDEGALIQANPWEVSEGTLGNYDWKFKSECYEDVSLKFTLKEKANLNLFVIMKKKPRINDDNSFHCQNPTTNEEKKSSFSFRFIQIANNSQQLFDTKNNKISYRSVINGKTSFGEIVPNDNPHHEGEAAPGNYEYIFSADGYNNTTINFTLKENETQYFDIILLRKETEGPQQEYGKISANFFTDKGEIFDSINTEIIYEFSFCQKTGEPCFESGWGFIHQSENLLIGYYDTEGVYSFRFWAKGFKQTKINLNVNQLTDHNLVVTLIPNDPNSTFQALTGGPYKVEGNTTTSFSGSQNGGKSPYEYSWRITPDDYTCTVDNTHIQNPTISCNTRGARTVELAVFDKKGNSAWSKTNYTNCFTNVKQDKKFFVVGNECEIGEILEKYNLKPNFINYYFDRENPIAQVEFHIFNTENTNGVGRRPVQISASTDLLLGTNVMQTAIFDHEEWTRNGIFVLLHETGHQWCCYIGNSIDQNGVFEDQSKPKILIKESAGGHYYYDLDSNYDVMGGASFEPTGEIINGKEVYEYGYNEGGWKFSPLSLYLMGAISPEEVGPIKQFKRFYHEQDDQIKAFLENTYSIQDIINSDGIRIPDYQKSQKNYTMTFFLISDNPENIPTWKEDRLNYLIENIDDNFSYATKNKIKMTILKPPQ